MRTTHPIRMAVMWVTFAAVVPIVVWIGGRMVSNREKESYRTEIERYERTRQTDIAPASRTLANVERRKWSLNAAGGSVETGDVNPVEAAMSSARPPEWTVPLAMPSKKPQPPNPLSPPPLRVNPERR